MIKYSILQQRVRMLDFNAVESIIVTCDVSARCSGLSLCGKNAIAIAVP